MNKSSNFFAMLQSYTNMYRIIGIIGLTVIFLAIVLKYEPGKEVANAVNEQIEVVSYPEKIISYPASFPVSYTN